MSYEHDDPELDRKLLMDAVLPPVRGKKMAFFVVDPEAFARWCEARGQTADETLEAMVAKITPRDRERADD